MQTLKQIKQWFANELYSWADDLDFIPWVLNQMKQDYIDELWTLDPDWEDENKIWEAWYVRWYEVALKDLLEKFKSDQVSYYNMFTRWSIEKMLKNLLDN